MADSRDPQPFLPLTPALFHVLLSLAGGDKHGYAIMKDVSGLTEGTVTLSAGTLYGILRRLVSDGMVVETGERPAPELDDERRRYYRMTTAGRKLARSEAERLADFLRVARAKRILRGDYV